MLNWRLSEEFNKPGARQTHDVRPVDLGPVWFHCNLYCNLGPKATGLRSGKDHDLCSLQFNSILFCLYSTKSQAPCIVR